MLETITYPKQREDALYTLAAMKEYLESSLDKQAEKQPWGKYWINYRQQGGKLVDVFQHLPTYAQTQYRQIIGLKGYIDAAHQTIINLQVESDGAYSRGVQRGKEIADRERRPMTYRELRWLKPEQARAISINEADQIFNL